MDAEKKKIRKACKEAYSYYAWRNPFRVWFVSLYDKDGNGIIEFQYTDDFPARERAWVRNLLEEIDERKIKNDK